MTEEQLRHRLAATAEVIDHSSAPIDTIRLAGRSLKRRRARMRVAGLAATVVAVVGVALVIPTLGPGSNGAAPATASPSPDAADCRPSETGDATAENPREVGPDCTTTPERPDAVDEPSLPPGGLKKTLGAELLAAGPAQRRAVEDNQVTRAEYQAGFDRYRRCLAERGHQLGAVDYSGLIIDYTVPGAAVDSGADTPCYQRQFRVVDMAWQGAHDDRTDDAANMRIVNDCLRANGLSPGLNPGEAMYLMMVAGLTDEECGLEPGQLE